MKRIITRKQEVLNRIKSEITTHFKTNKWKLRYDTYLWEAITDLLGRDFTKELDKVLFESDTYEYRLKLVDGHYVGYLYGKPKKKLTKKKNKSKITK